MRNYDETENYYDETIYSDDSYEESGVWVDDAYYEQTVYITADGYHYMQSESYDVEEDEYHEPIWTWRRIAYLLVAMVIIVSLVMYLVLPLLNFFSVAPPPPPSEPAWML